MPEELVMSKLGWIAVCGTILLYVVGHWVTKESADDFWKLMSGTIGTATVIAAARIGQRRRDRDHRDDHL